MRNPRKPKKSRKSKEPERPKNARTPRKPKKPWKPRKLRKFRKPRKPWHRLFETLKSKLGRFRHMVRWSMKEIEKGLSGPMKSSGAHRRNVWVGKHREQYFDTLWVMLVGRVAVSCRLPICPFILDCVVLLTYLPFYLRYKQTLLHTVLAFEPTMTVLSSM